MEEKKVRNEVILAVDSQGKVYRGRVEFYDDWINEFDPNDKNKTVEMCSFIFCDTPDDFCEKVKDTKAYKKVVEEFEDKTGLDYDAWINKGEKVKSWKRKREEMKKIKEVLERNRNKNAHIDI